MKHFRPLIHNHVPAYKCNGKIGPVLVHKEIHADASEIVVTNIISNSSSETNCKDRSKELWSNAEENRRLYNRLTLCITEPNGVKEVPNTKLRPQRDIHVEDLSICHRKDLRYFR